MPKKYEKVKRDRLVMRGMVQEAQNDKFSIKLENLETVIECTLSGKLRLNHINIDVRDMVEVEVCQDDTTKGRIVRRLKS
jgi:translation initiation factor IF-1